MLQRKPGELYRASIAPASGQQLASGEQLAPIEILSPAKRAALVTCLKGDGTLHKRYGVWVSEAAAADDKPVAGMTVADLSRDGMLTLTVLGKSASARLTTRGSWFARTAITSRQNNEMAAPAQFRDHRGRIGFISDGAIARHNGTGRNRDRLQKVI